MSDRCEVLVELLGNTLYAFHGEGHGEDAHDVLAALAFHVGLILSGAPDETSRQAAFRVVSKALQDGMQGIDGNTQSLH